MTWAEFALAYVGVTVVLMAVRRACTLFAEWAGGKVGVQGNAPVLPEEMASKKKLRVGGMAHCSHCFGKSFGALTVTHEREIHLWSRYSAGTWHPFHDVAVYRDHDGEYHLFLREGIKVDRMEQGCRPVTETHVVPKTVSVVPRTTFLFLLPWHMRKRARQEALAGEVMRQ